MKQKNLNKANAGFTLVELIVVIAIMAILAGVGTVGYGAYIKSTNKNADKTLVGNIMRAIETAASTPSNTGFSSVTSNYSTLESAPIGFVIVSSDDDVQTISVDSEGKVLDPGETTTEKFYYKSSKTGKWTSTNITYITATANIVRATKDIKDKVLGTSFTAVPKDSALLSGSTYTIANLNTKTYDTSNSTVLTDALEMAFGSDYATSLRLKYDGWYAEGNNLSVRANMSETWSRVLASIDQAAGLLNDVVNADSQLREQMQELQDAGYIVDGALTISKDKFMTQWNLGTDENEAFCVNNCKVVYSGLRVMWNSYLADYIIANSACTNVQEHAARISSYGDWKNFRLCTYNIMKNICETCAECGNTYITAGKAEKDKLVESSEIYKNGSAIYDYFVMAAAATADPNLEASKTYAEYLNQYMGQVDAVYTAVENAITNLEKDGKSYIVISVTTENGIVECNVIPETANPRK